MALQPEYVAVFAAKSAALAFSKAGVTEEDVLGKADAFVHTRDMGALEVKRVRLVSPQ